MQVNNINSVNQAPNFTAIKSVKYKGLYRDFTGEVSKVLQAFQSNPKALYFCKTHDVNIVVEAYNGLYKTEDGLNIFTMKYKKAATNSWQKFKNFFKPSNKISLVEYIYQYKGIEKDFKASTKKIIKRIISEKCKFKEEKELNTKLEKISVEEYKNEQLKPWIKQKTQKDNLRIKTVSEWILDREIKRFINSQNR